MAPKLFKGLLSAILIAALGSSGASATEGGVLNAILAQARENQNVVFAGYVRANQILIQAKVQFEDETTPLFLISAKPLSGSELVQIGFSRSISPSSRYFAVLAGLPSRLDLNSVTLPTVVRILRVQDDKVYWLGPQGEHEILGVEQSAQAVGAYASIVSGLGTGISHSQQILDLWSKAEREVLPDYIGVSPFSGKKRVVSSAAAARANTDFTKEKLNGPVEQFILQAKTRSMSFSADPAKKIGILHWAAVGDGQTIVIVPGRNEVGYHWAEVAYDLRAMGAKGDILVWDPPGQGLSDRLIPADPDVGHIGDFKDYSDSLQIFLKDVRAEFKQTPFVIAHSMGGAITLNAVAADTALATHVLLVAPMLDIHLSDSWFVEKAYSAVLEIVRRLKILQHVVLGRGGPSTRHTSDEVRYDWTMALQERIKGGVPAKSLGWVAAANHGLRTAIVNAGKIKIPITVLVAGADKIIDPLGAQELAERCKDNCRLITVPGSGHSIHQERDEIRKKFLETLKALVQPGCPEALRPG